MLLLDSVQFLRMASYMPSDTKMAAATSQAETKHQNFFGCLDLLAHGPLFMKGMPRMPETKPSATEASRRRASKSGATMSSAGKNWGYQSRAIEPAQSAVSMTAQIAMNVWVAMRSRFGIESVFILLLSPTARLRRDDIRRKAADKESRSNRLLDFLCHFNLFNGDTA